MRRRRSRLERYQARLALRLLSRSWQASAPVSAAMQYGACTSTSRLNEPNDRRPSAGPAEAWASERIGNEEDDSSITKRRRAGGTDGLQEVSKMARSCTDVSPDGALLVDATGTAGSAGVDRAGFAAGLTELPGAGPRCMTVMSDTAQGCHAHI